MFRLQYRDQALAKLVKTIAQTPKKLVIRSSVVFRAGTKEGPSFDLVRDKFDEGNLWWQGS